MVCNTERASSYNSSIVFEKDMGKMLNATPSRKAKENRVQSPPGLEKMDVFRDDQTASKRLNKSKSQPRVAGSKSMFQSYLDKWRRD